MKFLGNIVLIITTLSLCSCVNQSNFQSELKKVVEASHNEPDLINGLDSLMCAFPDESFAYDKWDEAIDCMSVLKSNDDRFRFYLVGNSSGKETTIIQFRTIDGSIVTDILDPFPEMMEMNGVKSPVFDKNVLRSKRQPNKNRTPSGIVEGFYPLQSNGKEALYLLCLSYITSTNSIFETCVIKLDGDRLIKVRAFNNNADLAGDILQEIAAPIFDKMLMNSSVKIIRHYNPDLQKLWFVEKIDDQFINQYKQYSWNGSNFILDGVTDDPELQEYHPE